MMKLIYVCLLLICIVFLQGTGSSSLTDENVENQSHHREKRLVHSYLNGRLIRVPYIAYVLKNGHYHCVGTILSDEVILTSANCIYEDNGIYSVLVAAAENGDSVMHMVTHKNVYSPFDPRSYENNLGLLIIHPPIIERDFVRRIQLRSESLPSNSVAVLTGWGITMPVLRSVVLETMAIQFCRNDYRALRGINDRDLCAVGRDRRGMCYPADSGGPLVVAGQLVGIYSWTGITRGALNPDVFVNLLNPVYQAWIYGNIRQRHGK